jgi:hypothetical protein
LADHLGRRQSFGAPILWAKLRQVNALRAWFSNAT